jgi:hypothetical protein
VPSEILNTETNTETYNYGNNIAMSMYYTMGNGSQKLGNIYYFTFVKNNVVIEGKTYTLFERKMPREFTLYYGTQNYALNVILYRTNISVSPNVTEIVGNITSANFELYINQSMNMVDNPQEVETDLSTLIANVNSLLTDIDLKQNKTDNLIKVAIANGSDTDINVVVGALNCINNRIKENVLKLTKNKIIRNRNKYTMASSRNFKSNLFSTYRQSTIRTTENKDLNYSNNFSNLNDNTYFLKTFRDKIHKKGFSKNYYHHSKQTKSDSKMKHIKLLKDKKLNSKIKQKNLVHTYISKKHCSTNTNLLANYISNYKYYKRNNMLNEMEFKKKNLTNFQRFSNNIKNVNLIQGFRNISRDKNMAFNTMINSACSLGTSTKHKNKTKNVIKISTYKILDNIPKLKYSKKCLYKKRCSKQEKESNSKKDSIIFNKK